MWRLILIIRCLEVCTQNLSGAESEVSRLRAKSGDFAVQADTRLEMLTSITISGAL